MPVLNINTAIIKDGNILLTKREDFEVWCIPGGAVDPGESVKQAAIREALEETGIHVEITHLVGIYSMPKWIAGGSHALLFTASPTSYEIKPDPAEVIDIGYFSIENLPQPLLYGHWQRISDALCGAGSALAWVQEATWPYEQYLSRQELYALRDQSGMSRPEFYQSLLDQSGSGDETLEVGFHLERRLPGK